MINIEKYKNDLEHLAAINNCIEDRRVYFDNVEDFQRALKINQIRRERNARRNANLSSRLFRVKYQLVDVAKIDRSLLELLKGES